MSDHGSGPRATANPEIDITDVFAFPSPERGGNLVAIMNVFPMAPPSTLFSDAIDYRIRLRPVRAVSPGPKAAFAVGEEERPFKTERTARKLYRTRDQAKADVFDYIERFYNPKRRHSTIGYLSPVEFENRMKLA